MQQEEKSAALFIYNGETPNPNSDTFSVDDEYGSSIKLAPKENETWGISTEWVLSHLKKLPFTVLLIVDDKIVIKYKIDKFKKTDGVYYVEFPDIILTFSKRGNNYVLTYIGYREL